MARRVPNRRSLVRELEAVRRRPPATRPRLLSFFLFDERGSQRAVQSFVDTEYAWFDNLARSSNILLFFFRENELDGVNDKNDVLIVDGKGKSANPSLEVAAKFGIGPDQLPGIVFFRDLDFNSREASRGIYWRIPTEIFREDRERVEREFAQLFSLVQRARRDSRDAASMFDELKSSLRQMERSGANRQFMALFGRGLMHVVTYPGKLIEAMVIAFGKGYGEALANKYT
jgi:hypothetical protein